jgi:predicted glycosyltransferase
MRSEDTLACSNLAETWIENKKKLRIALYSHDTMGIGHMRRNLLIAQVLAQSAAKGREPVILLIAGGREMCAFGLPAGTDCLTLPALDKENNGQYRARRWDMSLKELLNLRSRSIAASLCGFTPDVLIVDKVPRGAGGELEQALQELHAEGRTRYVLGLRDVLDDPETVRREWKESRAEEAISRFYDAVWIYGDRRVFDPVMEYQFGSQVAAKVSYSGYLVQKQQENFTARSDADAALGEHSYDLVLCLVGGGQDGSQLAETFAQTDFPAGTTGVILTGPFMPPQVQNRLQRLAQKNRRLRVLGFVTDSDLLLQRASRVVAMGGYNTICEILASKTPALIVPRVTPRQEQLIRAERMQELGLVDMLHPKDLSARALRNWLAGHPSQHGAGPSPSGSRGGFGCPIDLDGLGRLPRLLQTLVDSPRQSGPEGDVADARVHERSNPYAVF